MLDLATDNLGIDALGLHRCVSDYSAVTPFRTESDVAVFGKQPFECAFISLLRKKKEQRTNALRFHRANAPASPDDLQPAD